MFRLQSPRRLLSSVAAASVLVTSGAVAATTAPALADAGVSQTTVSVTATPQNGGLSEARNARTMPEFMTGVYDDVSSFWTDALTAANDPVPNPTFVWMPPGDSVNQACADPMGNTATNDSTADYCSIDNKIYFSQQMATDIWNGQFSANGDLIGGSTGGFSVAYAIAHEYAHSVQHALGIYAANPTLPTKQFELQADCLAGVWAHSAYERGELQGNDIEQAVTATEEVGDYDFSDPSHHGTPAERSQAFMLGYNTGQGSQCTLNLGDPNADSTDGSIFVIS